MVLQEIRDFHLHIMCHKSWMEVKNEIPHKEYFFTYSGVATALKKSFPTIVFLETRESIRTST
jgi:hypothetical protein